MQFMTLDQLLQLHALILSRDGGSDGVRDVGRLEAVIATQHQEVFGEELYHGAHEKAAALIRGIICDHPFADGNKRTAMLIGLTFIEVNGYQFKAKKGEIEDFAVSVATSHLDVAAIAAWLKVHSKVKP